MIDMIGFQPFNFPVKSCWWIPSPQFVLARKPCPKNHTPKAGKRLFIFADLLKLDEG
jgi:hypothetical protein